MIETRKNAGENGSARSRRAHVGPILFLIVCVGFVLRIVGVRFGFPLISNFYVRPDETLVIGRALNYWQSFGESDFLLYPGLMPIVLWSLYQAYFGLTSLVGTTTTPCLMADFAADCNPYFLIARIVSVLAGTASVVIVHRLATVLTSRRGALLAAALYAVAPLPVRDAHFGVTDTLMVLLLSWSCLYCLRFARGPQRLSTVVVGAMLLGMAVATKYTAIFLALPWIVAVFVSAHPSRLPLQRLQQALLGLCVGSATFLVFNLDLIIGFRSFLNEFSNLLGLFYMHSSAHPGQAPRRTISLILEGLSMGPGGLMALLLTGVMLFVIVRERWRSRSRLLPEQTVMLVAIVSLIAPLLPFRHGIPYRYLLPPMPLLATASILAYQMLARRWGMRKRYRLILLAMLFAPGLWASLNLDRLLCRLDTRTVCGRWIEANIPEDQPIYIFGGPECEPQLRETHSSIEQRVEYVHRLYGHRAGDLIAQIFRPRLEYGGANRRGYHLVRQPECVPNNRETLIAVVPSYPLAAAGFDPTVFERLYADSEVVQRIHFTSLRDPDAVYRLDEIDAFFLPMNRWNAIERPGPHLEVFVLRPHRKLPP